jgi:hypothetical protein
MARAKIRTANDLAVFQAAIRYEPTTGKLSWAADGSEIVVGTKGRINVNGCRVTGARLAWALGTGKWPDQRNVYAANNDETDLRLSNLRLRDEDRYDEYGKVSRFIHYKYSLRKHYGLTRAAYDRMYAAQDGLCAMCKEPERRRQRGTERPALLSVDHDHQTGKYRDLLCDRCNRLLGICDDNESLLSLGIEYLRRHRRAKFSVISEG